MNILIANLYKNATRISKQLMCHREAIAQVRQIGMDALAPSITIGFDLFGLARTMLPAISCFPLCAGLPIGIEINSVGGIHVKRIALCRANPRGDTGSSSPAASRRRSCDLSSASHDCRIPALPQGQVCPHRRQTDWGELRRVSSLPLSVCRVSSSMSDWG